MTFHPYPLALTAIALIALAAAPHAQDMPSAAPSAPEASERPAWQTHGIKPPNAASPFEEVVSGLYFRSKETQDMQADDFTNPGFLAVEQGEELWSKVEGAASQSCATCHNQASTSMKGVAAAYPKWNEKLGKPVNLEQRINSCRSGALKAGTWAFGSPELTAMTTYIRNQSRGVPVALKVDGPMTPWFERGKSLYYQRNGQLDLACASCHEKNHGKYLRADFLSQGQSNGFPVYRLRDQRLVPLHERMEGCMQDVRATPFEPLSDEFLALETYVAWRGLGLPVETPAVQLSVAPMTSRRDFLQIAAATAALVPTGWTRAFAQQRLTQDDLLAFEPLGNVTLVHLTDIHAQLRPVLFREPSTNLGVGEARGLVPHVTGRAYLDLYGIPGGWPLAYALTPQDFVALARSYGRMGGLDRIATVLDAIRAERGDKVLFLDGGDTWQNSYTSMLSKGQDMVDCMALLKPDAMTGHWEFTLGTDRVKEIVDGLGCAFLGQNVREAEWNEPAFESTKMFERGGAKVAVIGQAFPYTPIANPRWMIPNWSFGIREEDVQASVDKARQGGADLVVLLSHNGFDVDRKLASRVKGIDVVLTGHTHDALPHAVKVGNTLLIASGSHGKFLTRVDLDVRDGAVKGYRSKLIPIFSDVIAPQTAMAAKIRAIRSPHEAMLKEELGRTEGLLYRRGNFNGTLDDMICDALLSEREAEIALSPGFRWGTTLLPGQAITREDVYNATAITYPAAYRMPMTGARLKEVLEDVADNLFNVDPYYQQGGDMVRVGGVSYAIDVARPAGSRISNLTLLRTGKSIEADTSYTVAGWASVNEGTEGPPIWDVVTSHIKRMGTVNPTPAQVTVRGT